MIKKILCVIFASAALSAPAQARVDEVSYMKNGVYVGKINTYKINQTLYLDASRSAKLIGGKIYWYPVSGKLLLQNKGNKIVFFLKSDSVALNDTEISFPRPLIVRGGRAFLSMDFFVSRHFAAAFGFKLDYDASTGVLASQRKVNISSINHFSYKDKTRVVVYLEEPLDFQTSQKDNNLYSITVPGGVLSSEESIGIGDGVIKSIDMFQENKMARMVLTPGDDFGKVSYFKLSGPDRLVFDVEKSVRPISQSITGSLPAAPVPGSAAQVILPANPSPEESAAGTVSGTTPSAAGTPCEPAGGEGCPLVAGDALPGVNIPDKFVLDKGGVKRIVIDAGHGGKDAGGNKAFGLREKDINLQVAKELYGMLKDEEIFDVMMTRTSDVYLLLPDRSRVANDYKADIFISIHANAHRDRREKGFEVYFMSEKASDPWAAEVADFENSVLGLDEEGAGADPSAMLLHSLARNEYLNEGSQLAGLVSKELERSTPFVNRGVKQAAFYVLRGTYSPGILVEIGFMTNARDQKDMNDKKVRAKVANAIYKGVMKYAQMKGWK
ncbi:MAG TPA: N-acetylmuramoyl-L-alanine amidase [Elusimicrobiales bacterium]|nr:N-acetylmuramoyl-L-alanine amidase [Elusimicrobiales bacterium]